MQKKCPQHEYLVTALRMSTVPSSHHFHFVKTFSVCFNLNTVASLVMRRVHKSATATTPRRCGRVGSLQITERCGYSSGSREREMPSCAVIYGQSGSLSALS